MVCLQSCQYTYFMSSGINSAQSFSTFLLTNRPLRTVDKMGVNFFVFGTFFCLLAKSVWN